MNRISPPPLHAVRRRHLRMFIACVAVSTTMPLVASAADTTPPHAATQGHPLKGVITAVRPEDSALMVKHEAIPGVMRAMTMLFRVDAATLSQAKPGQTITAVLVREGDEWWLRNVKIIATPAAKP